MNRLNPALMLIFAALAIARATLAGEAWPNEAEIKANLIERIDVAHKGVGIVVGVIDEKGTRFISHGWADAEGKSAANADTVFELGSITKVFTSLLLEDMVKRGEMKLDDPISKYLPKTVKVPTRNGKEITLEDLATHTSGLPRLPDNLTPRDAANPYADYTVDKLYEFLGRCTLTRDIGAKYEYSNLGVGLLGHILTLKTGTNYEALVLERIGGPLGMTNTRITLTPKMKARLAVGHGDGGQAVENWDLAVLAGAGALRSTAKDMLAFAAANLGLAKSGLYDTMKSQQVPLREGGAPNTRVGLGWHTVTLHGTEIVTHSGGTGGYRTFIGLDPKKKRGVVVLANSVNGVDDIGFHLLDDQLELANFAAPKERSAIKADGKTLDGYVGRYQFSPLVFFNVRRRGEGLEAQLTGQSYFEIFPENETNFFYKVVDAQITFNRDAKSGVTGGLILHQNGQNQNAAKISSEPAKEHVAIHVDPKIYDGYAGKYTLAPGAIFTVRREEDRLMVQLTGQPVVEVFPESETDFFYRVVDAQLTFVKGKKGEITDLVLHQNGLDQTAARMKE